MGTSNPKVSAYVPQPIKERLTQFREDRSLSESQAVIAILAEYFQMEQSIDRLGKAGQIGGVTLSRMEALEERLAVFVELAENRLTALENATQKISELSLIQDKPLENNQSTDSLLGDLPVQLQSETELPEEDKTKIPVNLLGEPLFEIKPIPGTKLSTLRFELPKDAIAAIKGKGSLEKLISWTKNKDPDHIAWKFVESPSKGYIPAEQLSSELQSKLLKWIEENIK